MVSIKLARTGTKQPGTLSVRRARPKETYERCRDRDSGLLRPYDQGTDDRGQRGACGVLAGVGCPAHGLGAESPETHGPLAEAHLRHEGWIGIPVCDDTHLMKKLVEVIVRALVDNPDDVLVDEVAGGDQSVTYQVRVDERDAGRVIGKQGHTAQAIRTIVRAASVKAGQNATVEITSANGEHVDRGVGEES